MRSNDNTRGLAAPLAICLFALAGAANAATQTATPTDKKTAQPAPVKKTAGPAQSVPHQTRPGQTAAKKSTGQTPAERPGAARSHKALPPKPTKASAQPNIDASPKPVIPVEVSRRINTLEESNKALEARYSELSKSFAALNQRHEDLKTRVDNPPPPPPLPTPEVPAGPLVLTGLLGALLGFLGSLAGRVAKFRLPFGSRKEDTVPFPAPAEPIAMRQEPSVS